MNLSSQVKFTTTDIFGLTKNLLQISLPENHNLNVYYILMPFSHI